MGAWGPSSSRSDRAEQAHTHTRTRTCKGNASIVKTAQWPPFYFVLHVDKFFETQGDAAVVPRPSLSLPSSFPLSLPLPLSLSFFACKLGCALVPEIDLDFSGLSERAHHPPLQKKEKE